MSDPAASPFTIVEPRKPGLVGRILGRPPPENAVVAVNNLLAQLSSVRDLATDDLDAIADKHRINFSRRPHSKRLAELYAQFLEYCLEDRKLTPQEIQELKHLKHVLGLSDAMTEKIHERVATKVYGAAVAEVVADGRLDDDERQFLAELRDELTLPADVAARIYESGAKQALDARLDEALADERLTEEEERELAAIAESLDVRPDLSTTTRALLDRYRLYWLIENGQLPAVPAPFRLQDSETCHARREISWYQFRKSEKRATGGRSALGRIVKRTYWRVGGDAQRVAVDQLRHIGSGVAYLTSRRVFFQGDVRTLSLPLSSIVEYEPFSNGVRLVKSSGPAPFLEFEDDLDLFLSILERALADLD